MTFSPYIGYHKCNLLCICNLNTTIKGHLPGNVRGGYKLFRYGLKIKLSLKAYYKRSSGFLVWVYINGLINGMAWCEGFSKQLMDNSKRTILAITIF